MILTGLQRLELAFPAEAVLHVVDHGADPRDPDVQRVRRLLVGTVDEALSGLAGRDLRKLRTQLDRTMRAFLGPIVGVGGPCRCRRPDRLARPRPGARGRRPDAARGHAAVRRARGDAAGA